MEKEEILPDCSSCIVLIYPGAFTPLILLHGILEPGCLRQQPTWSWRIARLLIRPEIDRDFLNATHSAECTNFKGNAKDLLPRYLPNFLSMLLEVELEPATVD